MPCGIVIFVIHTHRRERERERKKREDERRWKKREKKGNSVACRMRRVQRQNGRTESHRVFALTALLLFLFQNTLELGL